MDEALKTGPKEIDFGKLDKSLSDQMIKSWNFLNKEMLIDHNCENLLNFSFISLYETINDPEKEILKNYVKDKTVVDLGSGSAFIKYKDFFLNLGSKKYLGVDLWNVDKEDDSDFKSDQYGEEVLSFISRQPDNSLEIITSNGFLCPEMFGNRDIYPKRVLFHIFRTLKTDGTFITSHFGLDDLATKSGFVLKETLNNENVSIYQKK
jgi:hypothetical protein